MTQIRLLSFGHKHQLHRCTSMVFATSMLLGTSPLHKLSSWCFSSRSLISIRPGIQFWLSFAVLQSKALGTLDQGKLQPALVES